MKVRSRVGCAHQYGAYPVGTAHPTSSFYPTWAFFRAAGGNAKVDRIRSLSRPTS
ncbi:hypothetical protein [Candidatus Thiosymbion oneisti]|uniref:hypothetical protein n=1 Tax=Candidatus Thiosymbion oneisti TaxID=589554 RepID=UPI001A9C4D97|nr:hypothetical protein [Candidatus Thiosymbion oneisti]